MTDQHNDFPSQRNDSPSHYLQNSTDDNLDEHIHEASVPAAIVKLPNPQAKKLRHSKTIIVAVTDGITGLINV